MVRSHISSKGEQVTYLASRDFHPRAEIGEKIYSYFLSTPHLICSCDILGTEEGREEREEVFQLRHCLINMKNCFGSFDSSLEVSQEVMALSH